MARFAGISIQPSFFKELDDLISDLEVTSTQFPIAMDKITQLYAATAYSFAKQYSAGPKINRNLGTVESVGPKRTVYTGRTTAGYRGRNKYTYALNRQRERTTNTAGAWTIPVRRITGQYYEGWYIQRVGMAVWRMSNRSREAWYIEFGINHEGRGLIDASTGKTYRVPRPIFKLSLLRAVQFARGTRFDLNAMREIMGNYLRGSRAQEPVSTPRSFYGVNIDYL